MENFSDIGKYLRIPCKKITNKNQSQFHSVIIDAIAEKLKTNQRNFLPLIVKEIDEEKYEVLLNDHVLEAANKAQLDFVWCIMADEQRGKQIEVESRQRFEINLLTASEKTIAEMFDYIKSIDSKFSQINPQEVARIIVENRSNQWKSFKPLTKLRCKIGRQKLDILGNFFCLPS
ncbi:MAG: hypothetical protein ACRC8K_14950 [Waterburya sp.]